MADTSTLQRLSNPSMKWLEFFPGGNDAFDNVPHINAQNSAADVLPHSFEDQIVDYPTSPRDDSLSTHSGDEHSAALRDYFLSTHTADEPLHLTPSVPTSMNPSMTRCRIRDAIRLVYQRNIEDSNWAAAGPHSHEPTHRDNIARCLFTLSADGTGSIGILGTEADVANAIAEFYLGFLRGYAEKDAAVDSRGQEVLASRLRASFEIDSVEDGIEHLAEGIIDESLRSANGEQVLEWLGAFCVDTSRPSFAASVLRCLGRNEYAGTFAWSVGIVRDGLATDIVEIRDAAVQAAESWADSDLIDVLRSHSDSEPWLRQYILDVIDDLGG